MADQQQKRDFVLNNPTVQINNDIEQFLSKLPAGWRFKPRDEELITNYLDKKVHNKPLPTDNIIEVDLYKYNPQDLTAMYKPLGDNEWYFFTPRDRKYPKGERPRRSTVDGYWKATGADKDIKKSSDKTTIIGHMTTLVYYTGPARHGKKADWIMREYRVDASKKEKGNKQLDNVVLCRLYKKIDKKSSKRKQKNDPNKPDDVKDDKVGDDKGSDVQSQRVVDALSKVMIPQHPISFASGPSQQYQNNFNYISTDYNTDSLDPMNELLAPSYLPDDQYSFMMLNGYNFLVDQNPMLPPMPPAQSQNALAIPLQNQQPPSKHSKPKAGNLNGVVVPVI